MKILTVNTQDAGGGAEKIAFQLFKQYQRVGHESFFAVGKKRTDDPAIVEIPNTNYTPELIRICQKLCMKICPNTKLEKYLNQFFKPSRVYNRLMGYEEFDFPGTRHLTELTPTPPDIIHCHNLHGPSLPGGGYFDLRVLPELSHKVPVVLTLHDAWLLSGHCAHSFGCERWKVGCGNCPDLGIYPSIIRDGTVHNLMVKSNIYAKSRVYVATPSRWLMDKVEKSALNKAIVESRIIPNGVDTNVFHPYDQAKAREELGLPKDAKILLFTANSIKENVWKDYKTLRVVIKELSERYGKELLFVALGEDAPREKIGDAVIEFIPYQTDNQIVARYYQASDVYIHAARVETFPNTILEALACGRPVVATAVGGIPEQVDDGRTGYLVGEGDAKKMAERVDELLKDDSLRAMMSSKAAAIAKDRFSLEKQANAYIDWFREIVG